jgi:hypothetical protein
MIKTRTDPVEEIWAIRSKIYEETKNMSPSERIEYQNRAVERMQEAIRNVKPRLNQFP